MEDQKGLYRSTTDVVIGGVAAGIARSLNIDPVVVRLLFVLLLIAGGGGLLLYVILWIVLPAEPYRAHQNYSDKKEDMETEKNNAQEQGSKTPQNVPPKQKNDGNLIAGLILITLGVIFLLDRWVRWIDFADLWPLILVVAGIVLIRNSFFKSK
jgi:phage shock protein PspC (stress-responsive transcriptional regulator)